MCFERIRKLFTIIALQCVLSEGTTIYLRGSEGFLPCFHEKDPTNDRGYMLICDEQASTQFTANLPFIQSDGIPITSVRITGHPDITTCAPDTFKATNKQSEQNQQGVQRITITKTSLRNFQADCFSGLSTLRELIIQNAEESTNKGIQNLFRELRSLPALETLHLINMDLSQGIPAGAFGEWASELRLIQFDNNHLTEIDENAFSMKTTMLKELRMERQSEGWKLLINAHLWARPLTSLRTISFTGTPLQPTEGHVIVDFGRAINKNLKTVILNDCLLTRLTKTPDTDDYGLSFANTLASALIELQLNHNKFHVIGSNKSSLDGLNGMNNLQFLSLENNQAVLYTVPPWRSTNDNGMSKLRELRIRRSGIKYIGPNAFPGSLQILHIGANPLRYVDELWISNLAQLRELHINHMRLDGVSIGGRRAAWTKALKPVAGKLSVLNLMGCQLQSEMFDRNKQNTDNHPEVNDGLRVDKRLQLDLNMFKQLRTLILNNNNLTYIPNNMIDELTELKQLSLAGNKIKTVETTRDLNDYKIGSHQLRLQRLDLRYNQLSTLDRCAPALGISDFLENLLPRRPVWLASETKEVDDYGIFVRGEKATISGVRTVDWLGGLSLTGNPMVCDCRLAWLRRYIRQMELDIAQEQSDRLLPKGYYEYQKEALDFICADSGRWKHRPFLSLRAEDLYAEDHESCRHRPQVYGQGTKPHVRLSPCVLSTVNNSHFNRVAFAITKPLIPEAYFGTTDSSTRLSGKVESGKLSTIAFTLLIIAGIISLCFVTVSTIIIVWLCWRVRRKKQKKFQIKQTKKLQSSTDSCCVSRMSLSDLRPNRTLQKRPTAVTYRSSENNFGKPTGFEFNNTNSIYEELTSVNYSQTPATGKRALKMTTLKTRPGETKKSTDHESEEAQRLFEENRCLLPPEVNANKNLYQSLVHTDVDNDRSIPDKSTTDEKIDIREDLSGSHSQSERENINQLDYQRILPWRCEMREPTKRWSDIVDRFRKSFMRNRPVKSATMNDGTRTMKKKEHPVSGRTTSTGEWRKFNWFRRTGTPTDENHSKSSQPFNLIEAEIVENSRKVQGPSLPKPQFALALTNDEEMSGTRQADIDYLPMADDSNEKIQDDQYGPRSLSKTAKPDEYVNPIRQDPVLDIKIKRNAAQLRRKPSRSADVLSDHSKGNDQQHRLRLSGNLYIFSPYEDMPKKEEYCNMPLPPPPPPPPPPLAEGSNTMATWKASQVKHAQRSPVSNKTALALPPLASKTNNQNKL